MWNISFAGCGFRSIYYVGALSCILERAPHLVDGASKICGASSGCLVAAALTVGIPIGELHLMNGTTFFLSVFARKHSLRVFHPTFSLLRTVRDSLLEELPQDAHRRASGRLCVSLTRMSDMKNVLVSEFDTREELIQFLTHILHLSASYHHRTRNTIIMAPFSGESDICPREGTYNALEVHYGNVSIKVNTGNVHRICTSFLPPRLEVGPHSGLSRLFNSQLFRHLLFPSSIQDVG
uniref:PNPLA domain-containing protein n=1 Tax=Salarias fasciatus TaxID=181472 RepID=A0A672J0L4_SALFA